MPDTEGMLGLDRALDKLQWSVAGDRYGQHPLDCGLYIQGILTVRNTSPDAACTCGLWDAIRLVASSRLYRLVREYERGGKLPNA